MNFNHRGNALLKLYRDTPGKIVRLTRATKDLTQHSMAEKLGIHRSVLSRYENGEYMPPGDILVRCLRLLGIDLVEMVMDDLQTKNDMVDKAAKMILKLLSQGTAYKSLGQILTVGLRNLSKDRVRDILQELRVLLGQE